MTGGEDQLDQEQTSDTEGEAIHQGHIFLHHDYIDQFFDI